MYGTIDVTEYEDGEYDLMNNQGSILLPQFWPDFVKSETDIHMRFHNAELNFNG